MLNITNESRVLQGPWTTLVKGRGLGANTEKFDPVKSSYIKEIFRIVDQSTVKSIPYNKFSKELCNFILDFNNPAIPFFQRKELHPRIDLVIASLKKIDDPYQYFLASAILFESFGKLGLDPHLWINKQIDLAEDALIQLQNLPAANEQECYKALEAHGNLFLGIAHIGLVDKLTKGNIDYVLQAFNIARGLQDVWHKGRGIAAFLTVLGLVGLGHYATRPDHNHLKDLVLYMNSSLEDKERVEKRPNEYVFSILLMINCIGVLDDLKYLEYKRDWIKVSNELLDILPLALKAIFSHYCLSTLDNLGLIHRYTNNTKACLQRLTESLMASGGGELDYMAYTYCVDIAHKLKLVDAIPDLLTDKLVENIATLYDFKNGVAPTNLFYRSGFMRTAYALTALSQMGKIDRIFETKSTESKSLVARLIANHIENWDESDDSFTTLNHALIDLSLSQRGSSVAPSVIDENVVIHKEKNQVKVKYLSRPEKSKISLHAYFPGMNSRRSYVNISRDLYEKGNQQVRAIFDKSSEILAEYGGLGGADVSRFFFEDTLPDDDVCEKWNCIGSSMTVYNLALFEHLKTSTSDFFINSVGGESYGVITAAIASNALSLGDGLKIANSALGIIYKHAHLNEFGKWHIVSLVGRSISQDLQEIKRIFPEGIDVFRWQTLSHEKEEVHVYINHRILNEIKEFIEESFGNTISFIEFKRPTIEIIHSPKLAPARIAISNFMIDENILFSRPDIPILANNGTGIASSADDVRNLILDMTNIPMYSAQSFQSFEEMVPADTDAIVELGYGKKTQSFIYEHGIRQPFFEYFGDDHKLQCTINNIKCIKGSMEPECLSDKYQSSSKSCHV
ncbi:MAG: hypothetical protein ACJAT7_001885 [Psychromonas sp.]|jgi:hypothetical protein